MVRKKLDATEDLRGLTRPSRKMTTRFSTSLAIASQQGMPTEVLVAFFQAIMMGCSPIIAQDDSELAWHIEEAPDGAELPTLAERAAAAKLLKEWGHGLTPQKVELTPPALNLDLEQMRQQGLAKAMQVLDLLRSPQIELTAGVPSPSGLSSSESESTEKTPGTFQPGSRSQNPDDFAGVSPESTPELGDETPTNAEQIFLEPE